MPHTGGGIKYRDVELCTHTSPNDVLSNFGVLVVLLRALGRAVRAARGGEAPIGAVLAAPADNGGALLAALLVAGAFVHHARLEARFGLNALLSVLIVLTSGALSMPLVTSRPLSGLFSLPPPTTVDLAARDLVNDVAFAALAALDVRAQAPPLTE